MKRCPPYRLPYRVKRSRHDELASAADAPRPSNRLPAIQPSRQRRAFHRPGAPGHGAPTGTESSAFGVPCSPAELSNCGTFRAFPGHRRGLGAPRRPGMHRPDTPPCGLPGRWRAECTRVSASSASPSSWSRRRVHRPGQAQVGGAREGVAATPEVHRLDRRQDGLEALVDHHVSWSTTGEVLGLLHGGQRVTPPLRRTQVRQNVPAGLEASGRVTSWRRRPQAVVPKDRARPSGTRCMVELVAPTQRQRHPRVRSMAGGTSGMGAGGGGRGGMPARRHGCPRDGGNRRAGMRLGTIPGDGVGGHELVHLGLDTGHVLQA